MGANYPMEKVVVPAGYEAEQLFAAGKYEQAAHTYLLLAESPSQLQSFFRLQAAQSFLYLAQEQKAHQLTDLVFINELTEQQRHQLYLLRTQLFLRSNNIEGAVDSLDLVSPSHLAYQYKRIYYETSALIYSLKGRFIDSVYERIVLSVYLPEVEEQVANQQAILSALAEVPLDTLETQLIYMQQDEIYAGWLELAILLHLHQKGSDGFNQALHRWETRYLFHTANGLIASGNLLGKKINREIGNIRQLAVLLPESGVYAYYAKVIKAGFMRAYQQQPSELQVDIRFYDTESGEIGGLYRQAVADGAQLVIGPLNKIHLQALVDLENLTVPLLALNHIDGLEKSNLYQFSLSPLDEVQKIVEQASIKGYKNALVLVPETKKGKRIADYIRESWSTAGGNLIDIQTFNGSSKDFSAPVKGMLNIQESQNRYKSLRNQLGRLDYNPRRRQDVDVVFMAASHKEARLIYPQFYHNRAADIPIYSLANVYSGQQDLTANVDLNGIHFCTLPWLFDNAYQGHLSQKVIINTQKLSEKPLRLIAFGVDAYQLVQHLGDLADIPYQGATGVLSLDESNRVVRDLVCAKFEQGEAKLDEGFKKTFLEPASEKVE